VDHRDLGPRSETLTWGLELTPAGLSGAQGLGALLIPGPQARGLFALVALPLASSDGLDFHWSRLCLL
jgi:hypothetical protein